MKPASANQWDAARELTSAKTLSIVMPAHNLGKTIASNIETVHKALEKEKICFEIVVVDDGSEDNTSDEIIKVASTHPTVKHVRLLRNFGKGAALKRGFEASMGEYLLLLDADLDLPVEQAGLFFQTMKEKDADIVIGCKMHPESDLNYPSHRRLMSTVYFMMVKTLIGLPVRDTQTGIKLFKRSALEAAFPRMLVKQFAFDLELLSIAYEFGFRIAEAPVTLDFQPGAYGFSPRAIWQISIDTMAIFYRTKILKYYKSISVERMPENPPLVSVVIACPAASAYLDECIDGLLKQTYTELEIIILPDNKTNISWEDSRIREIPTGAIRPAEKRNIGIREAKGEIVAFLDDDTFPEEDWLHNAIPHFTDPETGGVGGPAVTPASDPIMAGISGLIFANPLVSGGFRYRYAPGRVREVEDFPSCNLLVRTDLLRSIGGFRTDFWPGEDTYLCMDIVHEQKKKIIYDPRVMAYHHRRKIFLPHLRQVGRYALHRGFFARKFPTTSRKISYAMPSIFVLGLVFGGIASILLPPLRPYYLASLTIYAILTFLLSFSFSPFIWILSWIGVIATHIVYGVRFMIGILSNQMPETVALFDHPSEK